MRARDNQRVVRAGIAELLRPHPLHLVGFADHNGLHHPGFVRLALVELRQAIEGHHAQAHDGCLEARPAPPGQHSDFAASTHGGRPINVAPRQIACVVECAWIAEVARTPDARLELHALAVAQRGRRLAFARIGGDLYTRARIELNHEALTVA
jgi:hypothetical protein